MQSPSATVVAPARAVRGRIRVPGDKSISHRYALLAALSDGPTSIAGYSPGADCRSTLACLTDLGVVVERDLTGAATLIGRGLRGLRSPGRPLDAGNSGTTMRLLAGILAAQPFRSVLVGDESLSRRPMLRVIGPLARMGARIDAIDGHAPLTIDGGPLRPAAHQLETASAQLKSALLLAGLFAEGQTSVDEPAATRDHTERALTAFGVAVERDGLRVALTGPAALTPQALAVPGDLSSAAFWLVAAAALPGSRIEVVDVGLNPTRTALLDVLRQFGARVTVFDTGSAAGEPRGSIVVEPGERRAVVIGEADVPALIDELPAIAALAAHGAEVTVRGARELRVKETDRIAALVAGLRALGVEADEYDDGFAARGPDGGIRGGIADARGDHRMAMAFAIAALAGGSPSTITGADSVVISYPGFFDTLDGLVAGAPAGRTSR